MGEYVCVCCLLGMPCHQFRLEFVYPLGLVTVIPAECWKIEENQENEQR